MWADWDRHKSLRPEAVIIFDIPLLFEGGFDKDFDIVILVYTPREIQIGRLAARDGIPVEEAERTISMQFPIDSKKARSDFIIDNSGSPDFTRAQIQRVWEKLLG
jgi:dephospho-CoA kinase